MFRSIRWRARTFLSVHGRDNVRSFASSKRLIDVIWADKGERGLQYWNSSALNSFLIEDFLCSTFNTHYWSIVRYRINRFFFRNDILMRWWRCNPITICLKIKETTFDYLTTNMPRTIRRSMQLTTEKFSVCWHHSHDGLIYFLLELENMSCGHRWKSREKEKKERKTAKAWRENFRRKSLERHHKLFIQLIKLQKK